MVSEKRVLKRELQRADRNASGNERIHAGIEGRARTHTPLDIIHLLVGGAIASANSGRAG
jgi:hypothetical protein